MPSSTKRKSIKFHWRHISSVSKIAPEFPLRNSCVDQWIFKLGSFRSLGERGGPPRARGCVQIMIWYFVWLDLWQFLILFSLINTVMDITLLLALYHDRSTSFVLYLFYNDGSSYILFCSNSLRLLSTRSWMKYRFSLLPLHLQVLSDFYVQNRQMSMQ